MMKKLYPFFSVFIIGSLWGCGGGDSQDESTDVDSTATAEVCTYRVASDVASVYWTAYKYNNKTEVKGEMGDISLGNVDETESISDLISGINFTINTSSVNSQDTLRDGKIRKFFFGAMENGEKITGFVTSANGTDEKGSGELDLLINGVENSIPYEYVVEGDQIKLYADVNLNNWNCQDAVSSLHEKCEEKHTGADGESKLWPDFGIIAIAQFEKDCPE